MHTKHAAEQSQRELFQIDLEELIDMSHALDRLGIFIAGSRSNRRWAAPMIRVRVRPGSRRG